MSAPGPGADRRTLGLVVAALPVGALALWGASRAPWLSATWADAFRGTVVATANGADTEPVLVACALLALAGVAGVLATSGWGRRTVGAVLAVAGAVAAVRAVLGLSPPGVLPPPARRPGLLVGVEVTAGWPLLAVAGALLIAVAGVVVVWRAGRMPRLGAKYDAPRATGPGDTAHGRREAASAGRPVDPDQRLWDDLDAGRDPTADPAEPVPGRDPDPPARAARAGPRMDTETTDGVRRA